MVSLCCRKIPKGPSRHPIVFPNIHPETSCVTYSNSLVRDTANPLWTQEVRIMRGSKSVFDSRIMRATPPAKSSGVHTGVTPAFLANSGSKCCLIPDHSYATSRAYSRFYVAKLLVLRDKYALILL